MRPQKPKKPIQCGRRIKIVANWQFQCYDYVERCYYHCIGIGLPDNKYKCWTGDEWEWPNYNEDDDSDDQSLLTSVVTDGIPQTSASNDPPPVVASFLPTIKAGNQIDLRTEDASSEGDDSSLDSYTLKLEAY